MKKQTVRSPLPWNLGYALSTLGRGVQQEFAAALAPWGLRPLHYGVLFGLCEMGPTSQRALAAALAVDSGDLVGWLDTLEQAGWANRAPDPADRRRHIVSVTPAGAALLTELNAVAEQVITRFFAPLADDERDQLEALLTKLHDARFPAG